MSWVGIDLDAAVHLDANLAGLLGAAGDEAIDLQALVLKWPDLRGAIYSYAFELEHAGTLEPGGADCTCAWTAIPAPQPAFCSTGAFALEPDGPAA